MKNKAITTWIRSEGEDSISDGEELKETTWER
jgi:hypothetical protein